MVLIAVLPSLLRLYCVCFNAAAAATATAANGTYSYIACIIASLLSIATGTAAAAATATNGTYSCVACLLASLRFTAATAAAATATATEGEREEEEVERDPETIYSKNNIL